ncbi:porin [Burkholderia sp. Ac-20349]|uniref:porin n=1 Tax=Burkholderia sp. Ac-20349 TaxID=2703893 RepID=UPI00197B9623|nr:porin [Burkholderia sp. Ac-20349]MBN3838771.1 porin [Burkholderia sp. Ac-20349]
MKLKNIAMGIVVGSAAASSYAQSSLTLYGVLDVGFDYISNDHGKTNVTLSPGVLQGNRWGIKGKEDLGNGISVIFTLENGFSLTSGALGQGGREFGRASWIGLFSDRYGNLTIGRQYDSVVDYVQSMSSIPYTGLAHPFDNDNLDNDFRINNSVKYSSPSYGGFRFGGLYGFSNGGAVAGDNVGFATNRVWSAGASYSFGNFNLGAGYLHVNLPNTTTTGAVSGDYINVLNTSALGPLGLASSVRRQEVFAAGVGYQADPLSLGFVYSQSRFDSVDDRLKFNNYDVHLSYLFSPVFSVTASYVFTDVVLESTDTKGIYHQVQLIGDYLLSRRTDVYVLGAYQRVGAGAPVASIAPDTFGPGGASAPDQSTSKNQFLVRVALRHKF